jgi:hypothetical protein
MSDSVVGIQTTPVSRAASLSEVLNTTEHRRALQIFLVIVIGHWAEHLFQAYQVYVLGWAMPRALGMVGMVFPWLVRSETMHYAYALVMLIGLWVLRKGFTGRARTWWMISFGIQFWHHIEHALLLYQATTHHYLFGASMPMSIGQIWIRRMELHLIYNTIVFIPMVVGMYYHLYPPKNETAPITCNCRRHRQAAHQHVLQPQLGLE